MFRQPGTRLHRSGRACYQRLGQRKALGQGPDAPQRLHRQQEATSCPVMGLGPGGRQCVEDAIRPLEPAQIEMRHAKERHRVPSAGAVGSVERDRLHAVDVVGEENKDVFPGFRRLESRGLVRIVGGTGTPKRDLPLRPQGLEWVGRTCDRLRPIWKDVAEQRTEHVATPCSAGTSCAASFTLSGATSRHPRSRGSWSRRHAGEHRLLVLELEPPPRRRLHHGVPWHANRVDHAPVAEARRDPGQRRGRDAC